MNDLDTSRPVTRDDKGADLDYLEQAHAALRPAMAASRAASLRADRADVRSLAYDALLVQTTQLAALTACLELWGRPDSVPTAETPEGLLGLEGAVLETAYAVQLTAHAHASMVVARAQMVAGGDGRARGIAEESIRAQYRHLAGLDRLLPGVPRQA